MSIALTDYEIEIIVSTPNLLLNLAAELEIAAHDCRKASFPATAASYASRAGLMREEANHIKKANRIESEG